MVIKAPKAGHSAKQQDVTMAMSVVISVQRSLARMVLIQGTKMSVVVVQRVRMAGIGNNQAAIMARIFVANAPRKIVHKAIVRISRMKIVVEQKVVGLGQAKVTAARISVASVNPRNALRVKTSRAMFPPAAVQPERVGRRRQRDIMPGTTHVINANPKLAAQTRVQTAPPHLVVLVATVAGSVKRQAITMVKSHAIYALPTDAPKMKARVTRRQRAVMRARKVGRKS